MFEYGEPLKMTTIILKITHKHIFHRYINSLWRERWVFQLWTKTHNDRFHQYFFSLDFQSFFLCIFLVKWPWIIIIVLSQFLLAVFQNSHTISGYFNRIIEDGPKKNMEERWDSYPHTHTKTTNKQTNKQ